MRKILLSLVSVLFVSLFSLQHAFAYSHIANLSAGTNTYYDFFNEDYLGKWSVYFETRTNATSNYAGSGSGAIKLSWYYTNEISKQNASLIERGNTTLVDSYNDISYSYNTYCTPLNQALTVTMNKTVGWSSSLNPYITYPLKDGACAGQAYVTVNHIYVNRK